MLTIMAARLTNRRCTVSNFASTEAQSVSISAANLRRKKRFSNPPICSETQSASLKRARKRLLTTMCPPGISPASARALSSSTICLKRSRLSSLAVSNTSFKISSSSPACDVTALPRKKNHSALWSLSRMVDVSVLEPIPPVSRPIRWVSWT